jgi:hypothetical protein
MELHDVRLWTFPYTTQPAGAPLACGLGIRCVSIASMICAAVF